MSNPTTAPLPEGALREFFEQIVRFRGHFVSRQAAMRLAAELDKSPRAIRKALDLPHCTIARPDQVETAASVFNVLAAKRHEAPPPPAPGHNGGPPLDDTPFEPPLDETTPSPESLRA